MKSARKIHYVLIITCICLIIQLVISHKLWIPINREFPLINSLGFLDFRYGIAVDIILFSLTLSCLVALIFLPFKRVIIYLLILLLVLFVIEDIVRLQPWLYIFGLMLLTIAFLNSKEKGEEILFIFRLVFATTYFWSGFQKINYAFTVEIFPWLMSTFGLDKFFTEHHYFGYIIPFAELLAGIGLLSKRLQKPAGVLIIFIHLFLLVTLSPLGVNWNKVIWSWNAAMICIVFIIVPFKREDSYLGLIPSWKLVSKFWWFRIVFILIVIAPILNYFRLWDNHLSGSLYSGNNSEAIFYYDQSDRYNMPKSTSQLQFYTEGTSEEFIMIDQWVLDELDAPFYPQERYFKFVGKKLCNCAANKSKAGIKITVKDKFTSAQHLKIYPCDSLKNQ